MEASFRYYFDQFKQVVPNFIRNEVAEVIRTRISPGVQLQEVLTVEGCEGKEDDMHIPHTVDGFRNGILDIKKHIDERNAHITKILDDALTAQNVNLTSELQRQRDRLFSQDDLWKIMDFVQQCNSRWSGGGAATTDPRLSHVTYGRSESSGGMIWDLGGHTGKTTCRIYFSGR
jgi:hypothetical protein